MELVAHRFYLLGRRRRRPPVWAATHHPPSSSSEQIQGEKNSRTIAIPSGEIPN